MCLIRVRPDREEEVLVPNRPIRADVNPSRQGRNSYPAISATTADEHEQPTYDAEPRLHERIQPPEHAVIIQQISPRSSEVQIRHGSANSYSDGTVLVAPQEVHDSKRQRQVAQVRQQSGSLAFAKSPRQSSASYRSTRERIVVIDDSGRRREYYRRDDSGR